MPVELESEVHTVVRTGTSVKTVVVRTIVFVVIAALAIGGYLLWKDLQRFETTDDAQIDGHINAISARVSGNVTEVLAGDEQYVNAGDVLVRMDSKDYQVAVEKAKADLADAMATARSSVTDVPITSTTTSSTLAGAHSTRADAVASVSVAEQQLAAARSRLVTAEANVRVAQANDARAAQDVARYKQLIDKDEISKQLYDQAIASAGASHATLESQQALVGEAQQNIAVAEKTIDQMRTRVAQADAQVQSAQSGPQQVRVTQARAQSAEAKVAQKKADLEQAELNLQYTTIVAPVSGIVGKKSVEVGQNISPGQQLMAIVPVDDIWVIANFKETQLRRMHVGQPVTLKVDAYDREYTGKVERIAGASGARFSLLPPENATGNFVKVVQRIPVRIKLDPGQNSDHLLRPGMSLTPSVRVQ